MIIEVIAQRDERQCRFLRAEERANGIVLAEVGRCVVVFGFEHGQIEFQHGGIGRDIETIVRQRSIIFKTVDMIDKTEFPLALNTAEGKVDEVADAQADGVERAQESVDGDADRSSAFLQHFLCDLLGGFADKLVDFVSGQTGRVGCIVAELSEQRRFIGIEHLEQVAAFLLAVRPGTAVERPAGDLLPRRSELEEVGNARRDWESAIVRTDRGVKMAVKDRRNGGIAGGILAVVFG